MLVVTKGHALALCHQSCLGAVCFLGLMKAFFLKMPSARTFSCKAQTGVNIWETRGMSKGVSTAVWKSRAGITCSGLETELPTWAC